MKPAVSALNDWLKTIILHKSFNNLPIYKSGPHYANIELCRSSQYDYSSNDYVSTIIANINLIVKEIDGKLTNIVRFYMTMPTGFVDVTACDESKGVEFTNITLKNLIDFVDFFRNMYRYNGDDSLYYLYNGIPNHNNMGFHCDYKPFKGSYEQYFKEHKKEYDKFLEYREILFSYLGKYSQINAKKKAINKDFVKE